jgi:hypothetical protein
MLFLLQFILHFFGLTRLLKLFGCSFFGVASSHSINDDHPPPSSRTITHALTHTLTHNNNALLVSVTLMLQSAEDPSSGLFQYSEPLRQSDDI